jgi:hypothetical protein
LGFYFLFVEGFALDKQKIKPLLHGNSQRAIFLKSIHNQNLCYDSSRVMTMKALRRTIPFLLLNIIISAATTLAVLNWFGGGLHINQPPEPTLPVVLEPSATPGLPVQTAPPAATLAADASGRVIEIQTVVGPGDLNNESVQLRRLGEGDLRMAGWRLDDNNGHSFVFPDFVLNKGGAVLVATRPGTNSAIALFWGQQAAVWNPGITVTLYDTDGKIQAVYTVN